METIRVHSEFHAAHRQLEYPGKCRHVHGHTWKGSIVVRTERFPRNALDMSVDFGDLKKILKDMDHKMLVSETDEAFAAGGEFEDEGVVVIPGVNPSVENVADYCLAEIEGVIRSQYPDKGIAYHIEVTIQETDNNIFVSDREVTI